MSYFLKPKPQPPERTENLACDPDQKYLQNVDFRAGFWYPDRVQKHSGSGDVSASRSQAHELLKGTVDNARV